MTTEVELAFDNSDTDSSEVLYEVQATPTSPVLRIQKLFNEIQPPDPASQTSFSTSTLGIQVNPSTKPEQQSSWDKVTVHEIEIKTNAASKQVETTPLILRIKESQQRQKTVPSSSSSTLRVRSPKQVLPENQ